MNVKIHNKIPFEDLVERIRKVPLQVKDDEGSQIFVYRDADISLRELRVNEVNPTTFYLIRKGLQFQRDLREALLKQHKIDSLHLDCGLEIEVDECEKIWTLTPPIIEVTPRTVIYHPREGEIDHKEKAQIQVTIINDGAHRIGIAKESSSTFNAIYIVGADPEFPFYAHPNEWSRIKIVDEAPSDKRDRKFYSRENCYALYRDFGVIGCGAPRGSRDIGEK